MNKDIRLTIDERIKYKELKKKSPKLELLIIALPLYLYIYLGLFVIVMRYAFEIELKTPIILLISNLKELWMSILMMYLSLYVVSLFITRRRNRKLRETIISERKKR
jgi:uncharacterized membrane protein (DUF485 family)